MPPPPPPPPSIAYPSPAYSFSATVAAQIIQPTSKGGAVVSWSVAPALPTGLMLNTTDGSISGTPTAASPAANYVVTATNSGGQSAFTLTLAVGSAPILDIGHTTALALLRFNGSEVLSLDSAGVAGFETSQGRWVLQDYASGAFLATADLPACSEQFNCTDLCFTTSCVSPYPLVDLAGDTMVDPVPGGQFMQASGGSITAPSGVEIRQASTGTVLAMIPGKFWWYQLASDGSYVITASNTALTAYSRTGAMLFSVPAAAGHYRTAVTFSTPKAIEYAYQGTNVVWTIPLATGTASATPAYQGTFQAWFQDGARFLTLLASTVYSYSSAGAQLASTSVLPFQELGTARGPWWWTYGEGDTSKLNVYEVGGGAPTPFNVLSQIIASGPTLGALVSSSGASNQVAVIDLSGATPVSAAYTPPTGNITAYAAASATTWVAGDANGVVVDGASLAGTARFLTLGAVQSIAAGSAYYSVATSSGQILNFNASTNAAAGTIDFASSKLAASADGSVLAATTGYFLFYQVPPNATLNVYSVPAGTPINSFAYSSIVVPAISLSGSGTVLSQVPSSYSGCTASAAPVTGGPAIFCDSTGTIVKVQLSPDGTLVAASTSPFATLNPPVTTIYNNGVLTATVDGWIVGWPDNTEFLVDNYQRNAASPYNVEYLGNILYSSQGSIIGKPTLPVIVDTAEEETPDFSVISANAVYSPTLNSIYSLSASAPTWMSADPSTGTGAASSSQVVFTSGPRVLAQPY